jgi:predicted GH43/DUF377 family glycosyl hydrolase
MLIYKNTSMRNWREVYTKIKSLLICIFVISTTLIVLSNSTDIASAQVSLINGIPLLSGTHAPEDYQFDVLGNEFSVVGIRPNLGDDFDLEVYTDTSYTTLIESSTTLGDSVDFVALEKDTWTSPPIKGVRVTSGATSYVIEMENEIDSHTISDIWTGTMNVFPGNPVLDIGPYGSWDDAYCGNPYVFYDGMTYHMWYGGVGSNVKIGYAASLDGITWTKSSENPIIELGLANSWEDFGVHYPTVIYNGTTFQMWYSGNDYPNYRIGYATSPDGITWTKNPSNPVLNLGPGGSFDEFYAGQPSVYFDGVTYHMWYSGLTSGGIGRTGYATSPDGISWTKYASNPVLNTGPAGSWDDTRAYSPEVLYLGGVYHMWYAGLDGSNYRIGYASSPDGISWMKYSGNPVLDLGPSSTWDDHNVAWPSIVYDGSMFKMWYSGSDGINTRVGYATSPDGMNWTKFEYAEVLDAYEITGINAGSVYSLDLEVPSTADLDMFIYHTTGGRDDAVASSTNIGTGIAESIAFTAPSSGDYLLIITNENGGNGEYTIKPGSSPPVADAGDDQTVNEGDMVILDGSSSYDPQGGVISYGWDLDIDSDSDGDGDPTNDLDSTNSSPVYIYGDNGYFTATLRVVDETGATAIDSCNITVLNVNPTVDMESPTINVEISLRMAGSKWSNAEMTLYVEDQVIGFLEVERWPGSPDDNPSYGDPVIPLTLNLTKSYKAIVTYDPHPDSGDEIMGDQPNNGKDKQDNAGNPVWVIVNFPNGSQEKAHHTFNTQQSKKRGSTHWNHVDPWEINIMELLEGHSFEVSSHIADPGSDDLTLLFTYGSQVIIKEYLNSPPNLDPYPSPEVNPRDIMDITKITYEGDGALTITVEDDDGGFISHNVPL